MSGPVFLALVRGELALDFLLLCGHRGFIGRCGWRRRRIQESPELGRRSKIAGGRDSDRAGYDGA